MKQNEVIIEEFTVEEFEYKKVTKNGKMIATDKKAEFEYILYENNYISADVIIVNEKKTPREIIKKAHVSQVSYVDFRVYVYTAKVYDTKTKKIKAVYLQNLTDLTKKNVKFRVMIW